MSGRFHSLFLSFSKETNLLTTKWCAWWPFTLLMDECMAMHGEESMMEDFILDDGPATDKKRRSLF
jgi:hypothetical protein